MGYVCFISAFLVAFVVEQDSHSSKASRRRLLLSRSTPAELAAGGLAILLLAASVAWLAMALQARDAPFVLLALASIAAVLALVFYWLRLRMLRAAVAQDWPTWRRARRGWRASSVPPWRRSFPWTMPAHRAVQSHGGNPVRMPG